MKQAGTSLRRQGGVEPRSRYPVGHDNGWQRDREGSKRCFSRLLYARQFFKASRLRKAQQLMASSHARGKCSAGGGVPRPPSPRASFRPGRSPSQIPSFTAQAKRNSSWSPPASGCSFAKSSRHICRSSRNVHRSTFLAPATRRTSCHLLSSILCRAKIACKARYRASATLRRANQIPPPYMASWSASRSYPVGIPTSSHALASARRCRGKNTQKQRQHPWQTSALAICWDFRAKGEAAHGHRKENQTREREAERKAKELEMRIKARERVAEARRRAYEAELREAGVEGEVLYGEAAKR